MKKQFIEAGRIVGTHGVRGEMKLEVWADSAEFLKGLKTLYFDEGKEEIGLLSSRVHKRMLLFTIGSVHSPQEADLLRGKMVYFNRDHAKLPPNRYYIADLLGLSVYHGETGQYYGVIKEVFMTGANTVYRIVEGTREYLFPAVDSMLKSTDLEAGRVEVLPIPGIFDDGGYSDAH